MAAAAHASPAKVAEVERLSARLRDAPVVGLVSVAGIPAQQFQAMRRRLRQKVDIRVAKNSLLRLALERVAAERKGLSDLAVTLGGQMAVVTTSMNPFRLFKELEATKTSAPARGGEVAPEDIWVREGETPFKPGPIVGELQKAGVPAVIEKGKVLVKKDKLLVKAGDRIPRDVAQVLTRLEIYPLVVGLDLRGAYEDGQIYGRDVLAVDDAKILAQVGEAIRGAINLSVFTGHTTKFTLPFLLQTAFRRSLSLAVTAGFPTKETVKFLLAKAQAQALAVAAIAPGAGPSAAKTEGR